METLQDFKAGLFRTLANPVRIRILEALRAATSLTVGEIQQAVGAEPSNISQHLSIMRANGIVVSRREGTNIWYSVAEPELYALLDVAREIFERQLEARTRMLSSNPQE